VIARAATGVSRLRQRGRFLILLWFWQLCCQNHSNNTGFSALPVPEAKKAFAVATAQLVPKKAL
jgi:hypothetical protein